MKNAATDSENVLHLRRTFAAPRDKVFGALTRPEEIRRWFGPTEGYSAPSVEVDLRPWGAYGIVLKSPEGKFHRLSGIYREVRPPDRLVYTWRWEGEGDIGESLVTLDLRDAAGGTELSITQEPFPTRKSRDDHEGGWNGSLARLERIL